MDKIYTEGLNRFYFTVKYKYYSKIDYISNFSNIRNILTHLNRYITTGYYTYIYQNYYTTSCYKQFIIKATRNTTKVREELF